MRKIDTLFTSNGTITGELAMIKRVGKRERTV